MIVFKIVYLMTNSSHFSTFKHNIFLIKNLANAALTILIKICFMYIFNHRHYFHFEILFYFILKNEVWTRRDFKVNKNRTQNTALHLKHIIWLVEIMTQYANTKFTQSSLNTISIRELSVPTDGELHQCAFLKKFPVLS